MDIFTLLREVTLLPFDAPAPASQQSACLPAAAPLDTLGGSSSSSVVTLEGTLLGRVLATFEQHKSFVSLPTQRDAHGCTALHLCASRGFVQVAQLLLSHPDTDVNAIDEENGWTPLHRFAFFFVSFSTGGRRKKER